MQRLKIRLRSHVASARRWLLLAAWLLAFPLLGHAQQVLVPQGAVRLNGTVVGTNAGQVVQTVCANGFPTGLTMWERINGPEVSGTFANLTGGLRAVEFGCTPFTVSEGAGAATIAFGSSASAGWWGRPINGMTQRGPQVCPAGTVIAVLGGFDRMFNGASGNIYPTQITFVCRPVMVTAGDWFQVASSGGANFTLGLTADDGGTGPGSAVPGPVNAEKTVCPFSATGTCSGLVDTGGGELIDGFSGVSGKFPDARVSQRISFVNYAWDQTLGSSTNTAAWRPSVAGVVFYPPGVSNNTARYQQTYETYTSAGTNYSGNALPPTGTNSNSYSKSGTCATAHALGTNEDYTCSNIITGRPDLQVQVVVPSDGWTSYGQQRNVRLIAKNFGPAPTTGSDNSTAVLTLPTGWDTGTLPANCAKAGSPVVVTCQVNPTPLAASSGPNLTDGGEVGFDIPVFPQPSVATGSYSVPNGAKVCVQAATPGATHFCTVPNDANPNNDDGVNVNETATLVLAYNTPPKMAPSITTTVVSNGGVGSFSYLGNNGAAASPIVTTSPGVGASGPAKFLNTPATSTFILQSSAPAGFVLTGISCTGMAPGGTATYDLSTRRVTFDAAATDYGATILCTFTYTRVAVTVSKVTQGGTGSFGFSGTNGFTAQSIATTAAGTPAAGEQSGLTTVGAATTITEDAPPAGWKLKSIVCTGMGAGGTATPDLATRSVALNAAATAAGSNIACTFTNSIEPQLNLTKTASAPSFAVGTPASYTLTLANTGPVATTAVTTISDTVPATLTLGTMPAGCTATGQAVSCTVPAGLAATTGSVSFVIPVTPLAGAVPSVDNTATASGGGDTACNAAGNCTSSVTTPVLAQPRITVRKTKTNVTGTHTFGYTLTGVTNSADSIDVTALFTPQASATVHLGTAGIAATVQESSVPAGWPANPVSASCLDSAAATSGNPATELATFAGNTATLPASAMRSGAVITCTFTNTAAPVIAVDKTAPATVAAGGNIAYGLNLANTGAVDSGTSLVVSEQLPPGVVATSAVAGAGVTSVNCGTLPSAAGALLSCTMTLPAGGIPASTGVRGFTLNATAPIAATGTVLTNYASTSTSGVGAPATAAGAGCVSGNGVSCDSAQTSIVVGSGTASQSGLRIVTDNQLANGAAQDVLEVFIRDAAGNPVQAGTVVSFGATPNVAFNGGAVGAAGSCTTTAAATCQVTATSTVAAVYSATQVTVGGAVLSGSFSVGANSYLPSPQPYRFGTMPTVTIRKTSLGGTGTFSFTGTNGLAATQNITTTVDGTPASAATRPLAAANTATTITEGVPPGTYALVDASCTGMGAGGTASRNGRVLTLDAAATAPGSNIVCTFTNTADTNPPSPPIAPTVMCSTNAAIFNTGFDGPVGPPLTTGRDPVWESGIGAATGGPGTVATWARSYVGNKAPTAWIASPFGNANWISQYQTTHAGNVDIYHRFTFNMAASVNPASFSLKLDFYSDNSVAEIYVNGVLQSVGGVPQGGASPYAFRGFDPGTAASATLASNWQAGSNTVVVHIKSGAPYQGFLAQATTSALCSPATVTLQKTTTGGTGGPFNFTLTNTTQAAGSVSTVAAGTPAQVDGNTAAAGTQAFTASANGAVISITEAAVPGWNLAGATCTDAGTPVGSLGTGASGRTYTIPAASVQLGKSLQCVFTNAASASVTIRKVSVGTTGTFGFTGDNGLAAQSITTTAAGTPAAGAAQTLTTPGVATTITEDPLPADYLLTGISCTGLGAGGAATPDLPNRKVTLNAAATAPGSNIACTFTNTYSPPFPRVQLVKTTVGGVGANLFGFALSGLSTATDSITVTGEGSANGAANITGTAGTGVTIRESSPDGWPANPMSASCVDANSATPTTAFGTLTGNQLTIPAANMVAGAAITCTFVNGYPRSVTGRVFLDNGVGAGIANDGLINGGEAGIPGITVRLTDCGTTTLATTTTNGSGQYALGAPLGLGLNDPVCVEETNAASRISTGASLGSVSLRSGQAVAIAGISYTYTRSGTPDRIAFTWNGTGHAGLNFGDVDRNTLAADGAKTGQPGSTVSYPHTFMARTAGAVSFDIPSSVDTPAVSGWSGKIFADAGCTGSLQAGAALLYPPAAPVNVVAGQSVCILMQEFIPANAATGNGNASVVQASFVFTNAGPALSATYTVTDTTTVSTSALELKKEVRNVTQGGSFGINNQAKPGEVLEYRITYTNNGSSPISGMTVNDTTPQFTAFVAAQAGTTPATLANCQKRTPANPIPAATEACATAQTAGGTGALSWQFTGPLDPGASGAVLFTVKVN
ncbi:DUF11 domain-containing protein [Variovorax sp. Root434]|uniref:prealbumin-like fold domain-containing protein n=1 Tax=Variovorax sp. Root434 TaxID=1736536 RepID=UPI0006FBE10D|nr:DUF11 domain-containing protein [Variovorax sp. Root434]KQX34991.1 hypothetical protein ASD05_23620 [Variovorax sp. Root434]